METAITRREYEDLRGSIPPEYPVSAAAAVTELRSRGLNATQSTLEFAVRKEIAKPARGKRNFIWAAGDIDAVAEYLDSRQIFLPGAWAAHYMGAPYAALKRIEVSLAAMGHSLADCAVTFSRGEVSVEAPSE